MNTLRACSVLVLLALCAYGAPARADEDTPLTPGVFRTLGDRATLTEIVLPGRVLSWCEWPAEPGEDTPDSAAPFDLAVLVVPGPAGEEGAEDDDGDDDGAEDGGDDRLRQLYRLRGRMDDLRPVAENLPSELNAVAAPGVPGVLWLGGEGTIYRWRPGSAGSAVELELLLESPGLDLGALRRRGLLRSASSTEPARLAVPSVGRLRFFELDPDGLPRAVGEAPLPMEVRRRRTGLELSSLPVAPVEGTGALYAAGPDRLSDHRNRHLLIDPSSDTTDRVQETWTLFEDPEQIEGHRYLLLDGRPALVTTTSKANKIGIFEEQKARVFRLVADRTRAGKRPLLQVETESKKWHPVGMEVLDFDADGKDDLVLIQPEGMGGGELVVELYRGRGGSFERRSRKSKLDHDASDWHFGHDFDADGIPDLLLLAGRLYIYRGLPGQGRKLLDKEPWLALGTDGQSENRGSLRGRMQLLRPAPGRGAAESAGPKIVIVRHRGEGKDRRAVVRFVVLL